MIPVVIEKKELCTIVSNCFTDVQYVEGRPLIERHTILENIVNKYIDPKYKRFLAQPIEAENKETITWFGEVYIETPKRLSELQGVEFTEYNKIKEETLDHYNTLISSLRLAKKNNKADFLAKAIEFVDDRFVFCYDDIIVLGVWGMRLKENVKEPIGIAVIDLLEIKTYTITYFAGENGILRGNASIYKQIDTLIFDDDIPKVKPNEEYEFIGWDEAPKEYKVENNKKFTALYRKKGVYTITYDAGENGTLMGDTSINKQTDEFLSDNDIPEVESNEGYEFIGWDEEPNGHKVVDDKKFTAQYRKKENLSPDLDDDFAPWYKRFWRRFKEKYWE